MGSARIVALDFGCTLFYDTGCMSRFPSREWVETLGAVAELLRDHGHRAGARDLLEAFSMLDERMGGDGWERWLYYKLYHVLSILGITPSHGLVEKVYDTIIDEYSSRIRPYDDTRWFLERLREKGFLVALISNTDSHDLVAASLARHGLIQFFHTIVTSQAAGYKKPDPRIFRDTALFLGGEPGDMLYIGDTYRYDYRGAVAAGAHPLQLARHRECDAEPCVRSLWEAMEYIERHGEEIWGAAGASAKKP